MSITHREQKAQSNPTTKYQREMAAGSIFSFAILNDVEFKNVRCIAPADIRGGFVGVV